MTQRSSITLLALAALVFAGGTAWAGETCETATDLPQGVTAGDLGGAESVWFRFVAPETGDFGVNTHFAETQFATGLAVRESCAESAFANDKGGFPDRKAYLRVAMTAGQAYFIELGRVAGTGTAFQISVEVPLGMCPLTGDCFAANGDPGCDDTCGGPPCPGCCDLICGADAFCCDVEWDQICADTAIEQCQVVPVDLQSFDVEKR